MANEAYGELVPSNDVLGEGAQLSERLNEHGYAFLRGVLDRDAVTQVGSRMSAELERQGCVAVREHLPLWVSGGVESVDADALYRASDYESLVDASATVELMEQVFGMPVAVSRATNLRYQVPEDRVHESPPHQDHFTVGPNSDFKTFWIPLMDIDRTVGGLAIAAGSHRAGLIPHETHASAVSYQMEGRAQPAVPMDAVPGQWLTTDYRAGDVLVFESCTVHRGLPNTSPLVRFSLDVRAQPASTPVSWAWSHSIPEMKEHRRQVSVACQEEGLSVDQFEALMIQMHWRGFDFDRDVVCSLAAEMFGAR